MTMLKIISTMLVMLCLLLLLLLIENKALYERQLYECEQVLDLEKDNAYYRLLIYERATKE